VAEVTIRLVEIAELLGVSKQRVHQIADEDGFPLRSPRTPAVVCGIGARSQRGRSGGAARSPGASRGTRAVRGGRRLAQRGSRMGNESPPACPIV
jgi:hypothetical protein